ncbi:hypothetical protein H8A97_12890 [Bradyrhizobium sp. Arg62]|uniref:hypothetical protein n=1 Tax=Bradyrhizobium brasilense TaxID=1419277 RepID=UPI001E4F6113|nr:hypothetical protein [Bradyrhizobium brasilense]MCC8945969.1 hypothetical protein [Bradyrhizobium brasilense]
MTDQLIAAARAYCRAKDLSLSRVSTLIFNDGKRLDAIQAGGDLSTARYEHAMGWFSEHWPDLEPWPKGVERPALPARSEEP